MRRGGGMVMEKRGCRDGVGWMNKVNGDWIWWLVSCPSLLGDIPRVTRQYAFAFTALLADVSLRPSSAVADRILTVLPLSIPDSLPAPGIDL
jgi:hypothetical protein